MHKSTFGELSEAKQLTLAGIIAKYHLARKTKLLANDVERYALTITTLFKFEHEVIKYTHNFVHKIKILSF